MNSCSAFASQITHGQRTSSRWRGMENKSKSSTPAPGKLTEQVEPEERAVSTRAELR